MLIALGLSVCFLHVFCPAVGTWGHRGTKLLQHSTSIKQLWWIPGGIVANTGSGAIYVAEANGRPTDVTDATSTLIAVHGGTGKVLIKDRDARLSLKSAVDSTKFAGEALPDVVNGATVAAFSTDGTAAAVGTENGQVWLVGFGGAIKPRQLAQLRDSIRAIALSGDKRYVAVLTDTLYLVRLSDESSRAFRNVVGFDLRGCVFDPGSDKLAVYERYIDVVKIAEGFVETRLNIEGGTVRAAAYSPGGDYLAYGVGRGSPVSWRAGKLVVVRIADMKAAQVDLESPVTALAFHQDGAKIATGNQRGEIHLWSIGDLRFTRPAK